MSLSDTRKKEIASIIYVGLALLIFLSLYSYSPADPSLNSQAPEGAQISNYIGLVGSYLSDGLFQVFGWSAFLVPVLMLIEAGRTKQEVDGAEQKRIVEIRLIGVLLLFLSIMIICSLTIKNPEIDGFLPGGIVGDFFSKYLLRFFQVSGTYIITGIIFCLAVVLSTEFLFTRFFNWLSSLLASGVTYPHRKMKSRKEENEKKRKRKLRASTLAVSEPVTPRKKSPAPRVDDLPLFQAKKKDGEGAPYQLPSLDFLELPPKSQNPREYEDEIHATAERLETVLKQFGVIAEVTGYSRGPVITRYELEPASGVKVSRIVGLADDLALRLEARTIRIIAPIPGKAAVGIELPNETVQMVTQGELLHGKSYVQGAEKLRLALGKTISGEIFWADLEKMPHLLVAGATGAGKSVCINTIISNILYNATPEEVKFILIDPKRVELNIFEDLPHLLIPVIVEVDDASTALKWAVREMEYRYQNFARLGIRNMQGYNRFDAAKKEELGLDEKLPYIVVIVDEFADLMMLAGKEVEHSITRLAQMARAVGIHLVLATQRPSVDVITGLIKANFPARIAFKVASKIDSRTILDTNGAEKLLGEGDMLYSRSGATKPVRLQGPYVSREELLEITGFIKQQQSPEYAMEILQAVPVKEPGAGPQSESDELYHQAVRIVVEEQTASSSRLQRRLKIGYNRAARLIEEMEDEGIVGPLQNNNTRSVIMGREYLLQLDT